MDKEYKFGEWTITVKEKSKGEIQIIFSNNRIVFVFSKEDIYTDIVFHDDHPIVGH